jgi:DtxR family Mn-dependent transcriptional regulator
MKRENEIPARVPAFAGRPAEWIRAGVLSMRWPPWKQACPAGPPVADSEACMDCDSVLLVDVAAGRPAIVACLVGAAGPAITKLASLGVLPGVAVTVVQRRPVHVIRIGYTELALDAALTAHVRVRLERL